MAAQNSGGFAAFGGNLDVTLNNDAVTPIVWGGGYSDGTNLTGTTELQLNSTIADGVVTLHNSLNLATAITASHRIRVTDNISSTDDMAILTGTISGLGGIAAVGNGILVISGSNSYTGGTSIAAGMLRVADAASNLNLNATGGRLRFTGTGTAAAGVLETAGSLTNNIGVGAGEISWALSGGFSAFGGTLDVTLNDDADTALVWGTTNFITTTQSLIFSSTAANNVVNFNNAINFGGLTGTVRVFDNRTTNLDFAVMTGTLSNGGLIKVGEGLLVLSGVNSFSSGIMLGNIANTGGVLRGNAVTNLNIVGPDANNVLFNATAAGGGVLETWGTLTNSIGAGQGQFRWGTAGTTTSGSGGFSAFSASLDITLNNDAATPLVWGATANFLSTNAELQFGSVYSDSVVNFHNAINLGAASRTIRVTDNPDSPNDFARMTGVLSSNGPATVGFTKQGTGTLILTADNTFTGTTIVAGGTLQLGVGGTSGSVGGIVNVAVGTSVVFNRSDLYAMNGRVTGGGTS